MHKLVLVTMSKCRIYLAIKRIYTITNNFEIKINLNINLIIIRVRKFEYQRMYV